MNFIVIIQSRMTSRRYPGKMLAPFLGKPVLSHVVDRLKKTKISSQIILATSEENSDDPLATYSNQLGLKVVRGSLDDVMKRFVLCLEQYKCDAFFRVCGDSPLLLPFLFEHAASIFRKNNFDLVTNIFPRSFPAGMTVELIRTKTFLEAQKDIYQSEDREHITRYFYNNHKKFKIYNIECANSSYLNLKLAVDNPDDLIRLQEWDNKRNKDYDELFPIIETT